MGCKPRSRRSVCCHHGALTPGAGSAAQIRPCSTCQWWPRCSSPPARTSAPAPAPSPVTLCRSLSPRRGRPQLAGRAEGTPRADPSSTKRSRDAAAPATKHGCILQPNGATSCKWSCRAAACTTRGCSPHAQCDMGRAEAHAVLARSALAGGGGAQVDLFFWTYGRGEHVCCVI